MIHPPKLRRALARFFIIAGCICIFTSPVVTANGPDFRYVRKNNDLHNGHHKMQRRGGNSTQDNNQRHDRDGAQRNNQQSGENIAQHSYQTSAGKSTRPNGHGAVGNIGVNRHTHTPLHQNVISHRQQQYYINLYSAYPGHRSHASPSRQYYNQQYAQSYRNSRFPNSYRRSDYYRQIQPLNYGYYNNYPVNYSVNAWETLAQGQARIALNQFNNEVLAYPKAGIAKIGYALSAALSGDFKQAIVAMRRAFKIDPESLRYYQLDPRLQTMLDELIARYQYSLNHRGRHKDEAFMVAALSYLNNDYTSAHHALQRAEHDGDRSRSWRNLSDFLEEAQHSTRSTNQRNPHNY